jgi:hypothetical protein
VEWSTIDHAASNLLVTWFRVCDLGVVPIPLRSRLIPGLASRRQACIGILYLTSESRRGTQQGRNPATALTQVLPLTCSVRCLASGCTNANRMNGCDSIHSDWFQHDTLLHSALLVTGPFHSTRGSRRSSPHPAT